MNVKYNGSRGFSLAELLVVIILLGIVSVSVFSRLQVSTFQEAGFDQELKAAIRFAQKFALSSGCDVQVSIIAASDNYALSLRNDAVVSSPPCQIGASGTFATALNNPGSGGAYAGTAPGGVDVAGDLIFYYDRQGQPSIAGGSVTVGTGTITIEAVSGYVY